MSSEITDEAGEQHPTQPTRQTVFDSGRSNWWENGEKVKIGKTFTPRKIDNPLDRLTRKLGGRRSRTITERKSGRYIQARPSPGDAQDLAFDATLRAAAPFQQQRKEQRQKIAFAIRSSDFQKKIRVKKAANLVLFVVDASWSMAVAERMSATKGAILSLLTDAYQRRDRVGLVVFQKDHATLVLPPTNSVQLAQRALADIPVGGKTPLSAGLLLAHDVIKRERMAHPDVNPLIILLTDGAGNVSISNMPPQDEAHRIADTIAEDKIRCVVINMEHAAFDQGLAQALAEHLKSPCYTLSELKAETLYQRVRLEMSNNP
ncbi:MAG: vWA domain-containing protein [Anaerolineales bacterium]